ncbi:hypothetical protein GTO27_01070 [Candidatus Bathyarchaeota archaeon]|nr:hypothetical protein [Candidatus Bathyarchaeota archaeon]
MPYRIGEDVQMSFQIVDAKKHRLDDKAVRTLAEIQTHPKVMEWDVESIRKTQAK